MGTSSGVLAILSFLTWVLLHSCVHLVITSWAIKISFVGFPGGAVVENLPANAGDTGSSPGLGRSHMPRSSWATCHGAAGPVSHSY